MKTLILSLILLASIAAHSQEYDSWQKRDTTTKIIKRLPVKDTLTGKSEMKILPDKQTNDGQPQKATINVYKGSRSEEQKPTNSITIIQTPGESKQSEKTLNVKSIYLKGQDHFKPSTRRQNKFQGHWTGFYYGFVNTSMPDYSAYSPDTKEFMDFDWAGSFALQFNVVKYSIGLSPKGNIGLVTGLGFDYQRMRFADRKQSITMIDGKVSPLSLSDIGIHGIKRSTFKTLYLTIPLLMEVQIPARNKRSNSLYISGGVVGGIRMHSKTKVVYNDDGKHKRKEKDSFNMIPFKADATARIGFHDVTVWGSYTLTNMFKANKGPDMHPYTIGVGLTI